MPLALAAALTLCVAAGTARGQLASGPLPPSNTPPADLVVSPQLIGRRVEEVRVVGNAQVSTQVVLNQVRTREGDKFDPTTVQEDYQRIYALKRFSDVEAKVEPTSTGVVVVFQVTEQKLVHEIKFEGNLAVSSGDLEKAIDVQRNESIEPFRISLAKRSIVNLYRGKNYPFAHVDVNLDEVTRTGDVVFHIVQGPKVRIRKIAFLGAKSFSRGKLNDQVKSTRWYWIFNAGTFDPEEVEDDVAALQRFYQGKGFFDVKVGRKLVFSPDQSELQINFLINEGLRYKIDRVRFTGNASLTEARLRNNLLQTEGQYFDNEFLQRDVRNIVKDYSPLGFIYDPDSNDPDYLRIGKPSYPFTPVRVNFRHEAGTVELVYEIVEGKPFRIGRILVKGNSKSQDKLVLRELRVQPGQLYNSGEIEDAVDRLKGTPYFDNATVTPIGKDPDSRDLLVEVHEKQTATFSLGAGFNTNNGIQGNITYEQRNFDITNTPDDVRDILSDRAFIGAGQTFRISFEPGTEVTNASVLFSEPDLFDQPLSFTTEGYYHDLYREAWDEARAGGRFTFGKRFNYVWSSSLELRAEDVDVHGIEDYYPVQDRVNVVDRTTGLPYVGRNGQEITQTHSPRAVDILEEAGHSTITSASLTVRRDTTNHGPVVFKGTDTQATFTQYGALGGEFYFPKVVVGFDAYQQLAQDLLGRKTVLQESIDSGYIFGASPFYERFYGGGIGSIRGFEYRGVEPREGRDNDPVGGRLNLTSTLQLSYPIYSENVRGVIFTDAGTVEPDIHITTIRASVGVGVRLVLPFLGPQPIALDIAVPVHKAQLDGEQLFSFQFGSNF